jgi:formylglycine-generating enzyme required for sulfatase activity
MRSADLKEILVADVAIDLGVLDAAGAAAALLARLEAGAPDVLEAVPAADRGRVTAEVERLLAEAEGDPQAVIARRGLDPAIPATLKPAATHALAEAGARVRVPLHPIDDGRYMGFLPVGEGGMGVVYLALDTQLNRRVAFKMIRTGSSDPLDTTPAEPAADLVGRFLQEAWVTGSLEHPGIVPVYELGTTPSGAPYYTMRLVRGERTLDDAIAGTKTLEHRLALLEPFLKVCDTVRYAHSRGVVHRDLKPANIALGEFGEVVVLDWGLAKVEDRPDVADSRWQARIDDLRKETNLKTLADALGTPGYMAPEAVLGQAERVDSRTDVFGLGAILFRILTGRLPFETVSFSTYVIDVLAGVTEVPGAPSGLDHVCVKALAPRREDRYADAGELAAAIRAWQAESAVEREVRALLQEAETALWGARGLRGEALLGQIDRALSVSARILELRPGHEGAREIREGALKAREAAILERERSARRRQLKRVGIVALGIAVAAAVGVSLLLESKRREAERAREEAARERDAKGRALDQKARALDEVLRLADSKKVRDLVAEEDLLWPVHPDRAPAMASWLERAKVVIENRGDHEAALERLRRSAEPRAGAERTPGGAEGPWRFTEPADDWRHEVLADLLEGMTVLAATREKVESRHRAASTLRERSTGGEAWKAAIEEIAASPRYGGLRIAPQLGLVPLGPDPDSALQEFAHLGSGDVPVRDATTRRLVLDDKSAIILVLVPGATFRMGAQRTDASAPGFDPQAEDNEAPVHEVTLAPYFIGKHEVTQAQWERLSSGRPSGFADGLLVAGQRVTSLHPVEQVSWDDCERWLARHRLALPTEAQWENACRAGTVTPWSCGNDMKALGKAANIADAFCKAHGGPPMIPYTEEVDDGHAILAAVGSFAPNPFGLHDLHGNVWEWCSDTFGNYPGEAVTDPRNEGDGYRVLRGGSWFDAAPYARSSRRGSLHATLRHNILGVRAAGPVSPD